MKDSNNDGSVTIQEYLDFVGYMDPKTQTAFFYKFDKDNSGHVNVQEFVGGIQVRVVVKVKVL